MVVVVEVVVAVDKWWVAVDAWDEDHRPHYKPADEPNELSDVQPPTTAASTVERHTAAPKYPWLTQMPTTMGAVFYLGIVMMVDTI